MLCTDTQQERLSRQIFPSCDDMFRLLQIVRILNRLFIGILHKTRIAAEGVSDDVFFFRIFHGITSLCHLSPVQGKEDCLFPVEMVDYIQ